MPSSNEVAISATTCINILLRIRSVLNVFGPPEIEIHISCCSVISINLTTCPVGEISVQSCYE